MNYLILVNKKNRLSCDYIPDNLVLIPNRKEDKPNLKLYLNKKTYKEFIKMVNCAKIEAGLDIICDSGYRSFSYQKCLYDRKIKYNEDVSFLAKPGESEHQSGLCVDIAAIQNGVYIDNPKKLSREYAWLEKKSYKYGFILRYPLGKENITGYPYEPWHYRYVGKKVAKKIYNNDLTLEEWYENGKKC